MAPWRDALLNYLLLGTLSLTAGAAIMIVHGVLMHRRLRSAQSLSECVTKRAILLGIGAGLFTLLLLTQASVVPWDWLGTLTLLVATAPALLTWLGPPEEHVESCNLCQIGKGSAYGHYYGYLRLMQGVNGVRSRLKRFKEENPTGLTADELRDFYSQSVVVLAPTNGVYPPGDLSELRGVDSWKCDVPHFQCTVGGNRRSYGKFSVHEVTGSDGCKFYVALDRVDALATLRKLREHGPAGLKDTDCQKQMKEMMDELEQIVANSSHLRGQLTVVRYDPGEHVGDAIMQAIGRGQD